MLWIKNFLKTGFGTFCLVFVPALFFCFFLGTNNTFATTSTFSFDSSNMQSQVLCSSLGTSCDDFSYISISTHFLSGSTIRLRYQIDNSVNQDCSSSSNTNLTINFSPFTDQIFKSVHVCYLAFGDSYTWASSTGTIDITLYDTDIFNPPSCPPSSSGTLNISQNGTYDVTSYAEAVVDVPPEIEYGDYHDDLLSIKHSIYVCGAIVLVLYFFYCIYRMIIKSTGGF